MQQIPIIHVYCRHPVVEFLYLVHYSINHGVRQQKTHTNKKNAPGEIHRQYHIQDIVPALHLHHLNPLTAGVIQEYGISLLIRNDLVNLLQPTDL